MNKNNIAFTIMMIFAVIGIFFVMIVAHEFSHVLDYNKIDAIGDICLFNVPTNLSTSPVGYYEFTYQSNRTAQAEDIGKYTELKAYSISTLIAIIGLICFYVVVNRYINSNENI